MLGDVAAMRVCEDDALADVKLSRGDLVLRLPGTFKRVVDEAHSAKYPSNSRMADPTMRKSIVSLCCTYPARSDLSQIAFTRRGIPLL